MRTLRPRDVGQLAEGHTFEPMSSGSSVRDLSPCAMLPARSELVDSFETMLFHSPPPPSIPLTPGIISQRGKVKPSERQGLAGHLATS